MQIGAYGLTRTFGRTVVLDGVELKVASGETCAITGASGVGKSTLLQILAGLDHPDAGQVCWDGYPLPRSAAGRRRRFRQAIGWLGQSPLLDGQRSCLDNVLMPAAFRSQPQAHARAVSLLQRVGLAAQSDLRASALSGGQQVRCALVRALLVQPPCLIADEPTGTLDDPTANAVASVLCELAEQEGFTLVLATHDQQLASRCHARYHLDGGRLHASAAPDLA
jgi:predicted ABC-type transport system involved in lysophospholipase L1 biosynthesis ATPase subunit